MICVASWQDRICLCRSHQRSSSFIFVFQLKNGWLPLEKLVVFLHFPVFFAIAILHKECSAGIWLTFWNIFKSTLVLIYGTYLPIPCHDILWHIPANPGQLKERKQQQQPSGIHKLKLASKINATLEHSHISFVFANHRHKSLKIE